MRNMVNGIEDSLISTTALLVGIYSSGISNKNIITTGIVLIFVEAITMAYGSFVSEESFLLISKNSYTNFQLLTYSTIMFFSYILSGLISLSPFLLQLQNPHYYSIVFSGILLFIVIGFVQNNIKRAYVITFFGFIIMIISIFIGKYIKNY